MDLDDQDPGISTVSQQNLIDRSLSYAHPSKNFIIFEHSSGETYKQVKHNLRLAVEVINTQQKDNKYYVLINNFDY